MIYLHHVYVCSMQCCICLKMTGNSMVHMKLFLWFYTTKASEKILNFKTCTLNQLTIHNSCFKMWHTLIKPSILFSPSHV